MARTRKAAKGNSVKVDFTGVESSGNVQEGRHIVEVKEVELKTSDNTGNEYINWKLAAPGGMVYHTTSLQPQALWNLRNTLEALGLEVPDSSLDIDLTEFPGMSMGIEVEHEVYQGKKKPRVIDVFPVDEEEEPEEGEEPEEEEEGVTFEDLQDMDKDELLALAEEEDIKVLAKVKKNESKLREFLAGKLGLEPEEEEEPEEEPEEEEKPKTRRKKSTAKKEIKKGADVTFEDDGEDIEGTVASINKKEGFAVVDVDGEEWEVELEDITVV